VVEVATANVYAAVLVLLQPPGRQDSPGKQGSGRKKDPLDGDFWDDEEVMVKVAKGLGTRGLYIDSSSR
jgi:hypothetical protein